MPFMKKVSLFFLLQISVTTDSGASLLIAFFNLLGLLFIHGKLGVQKAKPHKPSSVDCLTLNK